MEYKINYNKKRVDKLLLEINIDKEDLILLNKKINKLGEEIKIINAQLKILK